LGGVETGSRFNFLLYCALIETSFRPKVEARRQRNLNKILYFKAEARRYKVEVNTILDRRLKN
jgi:hypothetical protein